MPNKSVWHFFYHILIQLETFWHKKYNGIITVSYVIAIFNSKTLINFKMTKLKIKPLADRVLIEPAKAETTTESGIIIPDTAQEKPQKGIVVAVGNGTKDHEMSVNIGDQVLYGKYSGTELKFEGTDYLMMQESDLLAII